MANLVTNRAKGRVNEYVNRVNNNDPANSVLVVIPIDAGSVTDDQLRDCDTFAEMITAGVTERSANNWNRKTFADADLGDPTVDDTANAQASDIPDFSWDPGPTAGAVTDLVLCYDSDSTGGDNTNLIPLTVHDFAVTPDGNKINATVNAAGFYSAS